MSVPREQNERPVVIGGSTERLAAGGSEPATVPLQPRPIGLIHQYQPQYDQTIFTLNWKPGDPARCRFCPTCRVNRHSTCQLVVPGKVEPRSSALFGSRIG